MVFWSEALGAYMGRCCNRRFHEVSLSWFEASGMKFGGQGVQEMQCVGSKRYS